MSRINSHQEFAVIGMGRFGGSLARDLTERGYSVLGIDRDATVVQRISEHITRAVALDATNDDALRAVDIASFDTVVVAIGTDFEANLLITSSLKAMGVRRVIAKALTKRQRAILERLGADQVVLPEFEAGLRLARALAEPNVLDRLDLGSDHRVIELRLPESLAGQSLGDAQLRRRYGLTVLAVKRDIQLHVSPAVEFILETDDLLVAIGTKQQIDQFCSDL